MMNPSFHESMCTPLFAFRIPSAWPSCSHWSPSTRVTVPWLCHGRTSYGHRSNNTLSRVGLVLDPVVHLKHRRFFGEKMFFHLWSFWNQDLHCKVVQGYSNTSARDSVPSNVFFASDKHHTELVGRGSKPTARFWFDIAQSRHCWVHFSALILCFVSNRNTIGAQGVEALLNPSSTQCHDLMLWCHATNLIWVVAKILQEWVF